MINIVFGLDDNYAKYCSVTMASILSNHKVLSDEYKIHFFFVGNLSDNNKKNLIELKKTQDFECTFINIDSSEFTGLPVSSNITQAAYNRLLIPSILPEMIKKAIYLDCDIIVNRDISELWNINIDNYLIAAVKDIPHKNRKDTDFNSGVIVFNAHNLKTFNFHSKWKNYIKIIDPNKLKYCWDQNILNDVITDKILFLPIEYNMLTNYAENYKANISTIVIVHFTGWKPWKYTCIHPLKYIFWQYIGLVPWEIKKEGCLLYSLKFLYKQLFFFLKLKYWKLIQKVIMAKIKGR